MPRASKHASAPIGVLTLGRLTIWPPSVGLLALCLLAWFSPATAEAGSTTHNVRVNGDIQAAITGPFDTVDVGNIGGVGMNNKNIVLFTAGLRIPITRNLMLGMSYDFPITTVKDIFEGRTTLNVNLEF